MKKILSVMMAVLLFATTAMAQGTATNVSVKKESLTKFDSRQKQNKKNYVQSLRKAPISSVKKNVAKSTNARLVLKNKNVRNNEQKQVRNMFAKQLAPVAPKTVYSVEATSFSSEYYVEDNDWYCVLDGEDYFFAFDIVADEIEEGVTYTLADMLVDYSKGGDYNAQAYIYYTSAEFTYSISTSTGRAHIEATVVSDEGDTYNITYDQPEPQTISVVCTAFAGQYYAADNDWYCGLADADGNEFDFDIVLPAGTTTLVPGTYTLADMLEDYCSATYQGTELTYTTATFTYSVNSSDNTGHVVASVLASDGNTYNLTYDATPLPVDFDSVYVDMTEVVLSDYTAANNMFQIIGNNDEYKCSLVLSGSQIAGNYTMDDVYGYGQYSILLYNDEQIEFGDAEIVITNGAAAGDYNCLAKLYAYDGNCYVVTMNYVQPVVNDSVTIVATNLTFDDSYLNLLGLAWIDASNEDYSLSFTVDGGDGVYQNPEVVLTDLASGEEISIYSGEIVVTNNVKNLTGWLLGYNNVKYILDLSFVMPESTRTETIVIPDGELYDYTSDMGVVQILGYNAAEDRYASVTFYTDQIAGSYNGNLAYANYCGVYEVAGEQALAQYSFLDMNVVVTYDEATETATLNGTMLCQNVSDPTDVPLFTLQITAPKAIIGLEYDAEDEDYNETFTNNDVQVDDSYFAQYGEVDLMAQNANGAVTYMVFVLDELDQNIIVPAGVYDISSDYLPGTVVASEGVVNNSVYPSYAGYVDGQYISTPLWFFEAGTVTVANVNNNIAVTVDATNSYGRSINITIGAGAGINDVNAANVALYPNPATDKLNVVADGVKTIEIIDATGRVVMTRYQAGSIDVSALANGIYMVRTMTNEGVSVQKIVKK